MHQKLRMPLTFILNDSGGRYTNWCTIITVVAAVSASSVLRRNKVHAQRQQVVESQLRTKQTLQHLHYKVHCSE
jgi:hypothetical protein